MGMKIQFEHLQKQDSNKEWKFQFSLIVKRMILSACEDLSVLFGSKPLKRMSPFLHGS